MSEYKAIYRMIETTEYVEDSGNITAYGVGCRTEDIAGENGGMNEQSIPNISTSSAFVAELIERLNNHEADPIHLSELIDDYLP